MRQPKKSPERGVGRQPSIRTLVLLLMAALCLIGAGCSGVKQDDKTKELISSTAQESGPVSDFEYVESDEGGVVTFKCQIGGWGKYEGIHDGEWVEFHSVDD